MERIEKKYCPHCKTLVIMVLALVSPDGVRYLRCMLCLNLIREDLTIVVEPPEEPEVD